MPPLKVMSVRNPPEPIKLISRGRCRRGSPAFSPVLTILDEKTDLLIPGRRAHGDHDVLQTCRLGCRPMDTIDPARRNWNGCQVKLEVAHLSIEDVGRNPIRVVRIVVAIVSITIDESNTTEACGRFYGWKVGRISNDIGVVLVNNGTRNQVRSGRKVDCCRSQSAGCAESATSTSRQDGIVNCRRVVGNAITLRIPMSATAR